MLASAPLLLLLTLSKGYLFFSKKVSSNEPVVSEWNDEDIEDGWTVVPALEAGLDVVTVAPTVEKTFNPKDLANMIEDYRNRNRYELGWKLFTELGEFSEEVAKAETTNDMVALIDFLLENIACQEEIRSLFFDYRWLEMNEKYVQHGKVGSEGDRALFIDQLSAIMGEHFGVPPPRVCACSDQTTSKVIVLVGYFEEIYDTLSEVIEATFWLTYNGGMVITAPISVPLVSVISGFIPGMHEFHEDFLQIGWIYLYPWALMATLVQNAVSSLLPRYRKRHPLIHSY